MYDTVADAVKNFDPDAEERDESLEFHETEAVGYFEMLTRFSNGCDKALLCIGFFWSMVFGGAMPGFSVVFGELIDDLGAQEPGGGSNPMKDNTLLMLYVALFAFVSSAFYISAFSVLSERVQFKLKIEYLKSALSKDAAFYDE